MADATHDWAEQVDCDMRMDYLISRAEAEAEKQLAVAAALREAADTASTWWDDPQMREAILALIPDGGSALDRALAEAVRPYRIALADAIRRPMGVVPASAEGLVTTAELGAAEDRRVQDARDIAAAIRAQGET